MFGVEKSGNVCKVTRVTRETAIELELWSCGEATGVLEGRTGIGFFDHMLATFAKFSKLGLRVLKFEADTEVDLHHGVEDFGIALGRAFKEVFDYNTVARFGHAIVPMDEALTLASVDLSGRPFLGYEVSFRTPSVGVFPTELIEEFLRAFVNNATVTLHVRNLAGSNAHHIAESVFKSVGVAMAMATRSVEGPMSTKGVVVP